MCVTGQVPKLLLLVVTRRLWTLTWFFTLRSRRGIAGGLTQSPGSVMLSLTVPDFKFKIRSDAGGIHEIVAGFFGLAKSGGLQVTAARAAGWVSHSTMN
jgi:hypothetical protein